MNRKSCVSYICYLLILIFLTTSLSGCKNKNVTAETVLVKPEVTSIPGLTDGIQSIDAMSSNNQNAIVETATIAPLPTDSLTEEQRNSINMLNFLTVLTLEITESKDSRVYLEDAYSSLVNNTYPNAVDRDTLDRLNDILDALETFRMLDVKRDRLNYIYEQNKAQALRNAVPNPIGLLSAMQAEDIASLVTSLAYMVIDSAARYKTVSAQADMTFLQDNWMLDDNEAETLHALRSDAFAYMVTMVNEYDLPGDSSLNTDSVSAFVKIKSETNVTRRIQLLIDNREKYVEFGPYWLLLARSYYEEGLYNECLTAIANYEKIQTRIFRQDFEFANVLPLAIHAKREISSNDEYISYAEQHLDIMVRNIASEDWALRYIAAQLYIDLYDRSGDVVYLQIAYNLARENVTLLVGEQHELNETYTGSLVELDVPKDADKEKKQEIQSYNNMIAKERKIALPPVSDALLLNCDLLFALTDHIEQSEEEAEKIDKILHGDKRLFLTAPLDALYWFSDSVPQVSNNQIDVVFEKDTFTIPAAYVADGAAVVVTVTDETGSYEFSDWTVAKVTRKDENDFDSFTVTFTCSTMKKHDMEAGSQILITVIPKQDSQAESLVFTYTAEEKKTLGVIPGIEYIRK